MLRKVTVIKSILQYLLCTKKKKQVEQLANIIRIIWPIFLYFPHEPIHCTAYLPCLSEQFLPLPFKTYQYDSFPGPGKQLFRKKKENYHAILFLLYFLFLKFFYYFNTFLMKTIYLWTLNSDVCSIYWTNFLRNIMNENSLIIPPFWETIFYSIYKAIYVLCEHNRDLIQVFIFMPCVFILFFRYRSAPGTHIWKVSHWSISNWRCIIGWRFSFRSTCKMTSPSSVSQYYEEF